MLLILDKGVTPDKVPYGGTPTGGYALYPPT